MIQFRLALGLILLGLLFACAFPLPESGLQPIPVPGYSTGEPGLRQAQPPGEGLPPGEGMSTTPIPVPGYSTGEPGLRQAQPPGEGLPPGKRQPTAEAPGALVLRTLAEEQQRPSYYVFSNYPYLTDGSSAKTAFAFNQAVEGQLLQQLALFKIDLASFRSESFSFSHPSTFLSGFQIHTATRELVSLEMDLSIYHAGAAHPLPSTLTVTFSLENGQPLTLADLFVPGAAYLDRLAELAAGQLWERGTLLFDEGIAPTAENFAHWVVTPHGLTLIFDVNQVGPYAAGVQRVTIPFDQLTGLLVDGAPPSGLSAAPLTVERMLMPIQLPDPAQLEA